MVTYQTLIRLSLNPPNNFLPRGFQTNDMHEAGLVFLDLVDYSFLLGSQTKSTIGFSLSLPKSQTLIPFSVAADTHCNLGLN